MGRIRGELHERVRVTATKLEPLSGGPSSRKSSHGSPRFQGHLRAFKYVRLESYQDAPKNLELKRTARQSSLLDADTQLREQYVRSYMLDVESRGSQTLLNVEGEFHRHAFDVQHV